MIPPYSTLIPPTIIAKISTVIIAINPTATTPAAYDAPNPNNISNLRKIQFLFNITLIVQIINLTSL
jgi:hypothetical protein